MLKNCQVLCKMPLGHSDLNLIGWKRIGAASHFFQIILNKPKKMAFFCHMKRNDLKMSTAGTSLLKPVEVEVIQLFAKYSSAPGQLRSVGQIHGWPFVSHLPLTLNGLKEQLDLGNGSTSQGLNFLANWAAHRQ